MSAKKYKYKVKLDYDYLYKSYWILGKTTIEMAKEKNCSCPTISMRMKRLGIPLRTASERKSGPRNPSFGKSGDKSARWGMRHSKDAKKKIAEKVPRGSKHMRWKSPETRIEPVNKQIRNCYKMKTWREKVFQRDEYTCVQCKKMRSSAVNINADHIKPFAAIKKEYGINSLAEALLCDELWNTSNGRTLCEPCHRKTDTWGNRPKGKQ